MIRLFLACGYLFLYTPIVLVVVYSFNKSRLVTVWSGFSTQWYPALLSDRELMAAIARSFEVAVVSATGAVILGAMAAYALVRIRNFKGWRLFKTLLNFPFIIPEVIIGFAMLMLFVMLQRTVGWPDGRGLGTIMMAHMTVGMAYVAILAQARLSQMDGSVEEAALDLGAKPLAVFIHVLLPMMLPSLIAGWLLTLTLSLDDVVIASFTSGPGSTTLPMLILSRVKLGISPSINALATIMILLVMVAASMAYLLITHGHKRTFRKRKQQDSHAT